MEMRPELRRRLLRASDVRALVDELEGEADALSGASASAAALFEVAQIAEELVPERERALDLYTRAVDRDPSLQAAHERVRSLARGLGRPELIAELTERQLAQSSDPKWQAELVASLAEAELEMGSAMRALAVLVDWAPSLPRTERIEDLRAAVERTDDWRHEVELAVVSAARAESREAARLFVRAARTVAAADPADAMQEQLLLRALDRDPRSEDAARLVESLLAGQQRWDALIAHQERRVSSSAGPAIASALCVEFALRWSERWRDRERALAWIEMALAKRAGLPIAAFVLLRELCAARGDATRFLALVDEGMAAPLPPEVALHAALAAGEVAWRQLGDPELARTYFDRVLLLDPEHPAPPRFTAEVAPIPEAQRALMVAARRAESGGSLDNAIGAWRRAITAEPTTRPPRRQVARVLRSGERWAALVDALKAEEAFSCTTDEERVEVLLELAAVARDQLKQDLLVISTLTRVLERVPHHMAALDGLVVHYTAVKRWADVAATLARKASFIAEPRDRAALFLEIARLHLERMANQTDAIRAWESALESDPVNVEAVARLREAYERRRDWEKLVDLEKRQALAIDDESLRLVRLIGVARLTVEKLRRAPMSIAAWREVLTLAPANEDALTALEKLHESERQWTELTSILDLELELAKDPGRRALLLQKLAIIYQDQLEDSDRAVATWRQLLVLVPRHPRAQDALRKLLLARGAWQELEDLYASLGKIEECVRAFERQVEVEDDKNKIELWLRVARLAGEQLDKPSLARRAFENVLSLDSQNLAAAEGLIPFYVEDKDHASLLQVLEIQLNQTSDKMLRHDRIGRVAVLCEEGLGDPEAAFRWRAQGLGEEPSSVATVRELERLAIEMRAWNLLAQTLRDVLSRPLPLEAQVFLRVRLGRIYHKELNQIDRAISTYRRVLDLRGEHRESLTAMAELLEESGQWKDLIAVLEAQAQHATDEERHPIELKLALVFEQHLDDRGRAIAVYKELLARQPGDLPTLTALERLLEGSARAEAAALLAPLDRAAGRWERLLKTREVQLEATTDVEQRVALLSRMAELAEKELPGGGARAITYWARALAEDPRSLQPVLEMDRLARLTGRYDELVDVLLAILERAGDDRDLLLRAAHAVDEGLRDPARAAELYRRALALDPGDVETLAALDRVYEATGRHRELADVLQLRLETIHDAPLLVSIGVRLGWLEEKTLDNLDAATAAWRRVLDLEPDNVDAIAGLERIYTTRGEWAALDALYGHQVKFATDPDTLALVYTRLARLAASHDMGGSSERALERWTRVLDLKPGDLEAVAGISQVLEREERWVELVELLERQATNPQVELSPLEQAEQWKRIGRLWQDKLAGESDALLAWMNADALVPGELETLRALATLLESADSPEQLADVLRQLLDLSELPESDAYDIAARLGRVEMNSLGRVDEAAVAWRHALALRPGDPDALEALQEIYSRAGYWPEYVEIVEERAATGEGGAPRIDLLLQAAAAREQQLHDRPGAVRLYEQVRGLRPDDAVARERLEAWYRDAERWADLAALLGERAEAMPPSVERARLRLETAQLREQRLGDRAGSFELLRAAWRDDPTSESVAAAISLLAGLLGRWQELYDDMLEVARRLEVEEVGHAVEAWLAVARVAAEKLNRPDDARAALEAAQRLDPSDARTLTPLAATYRRNGSWAELHALQTRLLAFESEPARRVALLRSQASLLDGELDDPAGAIEAWRMLLDATPGETDRAEALASLERLYEATGRSEELLDLVDRRREDATDPALRAALWRKMVAIWERQIGDPEAPPAAEGRTRFDARGTGRYRELERHYEREKSWRWLLCAYRHHLDETDDRATRVELLCACGLLLEGELGAPDRAAASYLNAFELEPGEARPLEGLARIYALRGWPSDPALLERLQRSFRAAQHTTGEMGATVRLASLEKDPTRRARMLQEAAFLARDRLPAVDVVVEHLHAAFDAWVAVGTRAASESAVEVSVVLDQVYTRTSDWRGLARSYRRRIDRLPRTKGDPLLIRLWSLLAELLATHLGDPVAAGKAQEVATTLSERVE